MTGSRDRNFFDPVYLLIALYYLIILFPIFTPGVLITGDHPNHLSHIGFLKSMGWPVRALWLFNPQTVAGFPEGELYPHLGYQLVILISLIPGISLELAYKLALFATILLPPILFYTLLRRSFPAHLAFLGLSFFLIYSNFIKFVFFGMWSFYLGFGFALWFLLSLIGGKEERARISPLDTRPSRREPVGSAVWSLRRIAALSILAALTLLSHPTVFYFLLLILVALNIVGLFNRERSITLIIKRAGASLLIILFSLTITAFYWLPLLRQERTSEVKPYLNFDEEMNLFSEPSSSEKANGEALRDDWDRSQAVAERRTVRGWLLSFVTLDYVNNIELPTKLTELLKDWRLDQFYLKLTYLLLLDFIQNLPLLFALLFLFRLITVRSRLSGLRSQPSNPQTGENAFLFENKKATLDLGPWTLDLVTRVALSVGILSLLLLTLSYFVKHLIIFPYALYRYHFLIRTSAILLTVALFHSRTLTFQPSRLPHKRLAPYVYPLILLLLCGPFIINRLAFTKETAQNPYLSSAKEVWNWLSLHKPAPGERILYQSTYLNSSDLVVKNSHFLALSSLRTGVPELGASPVYPLPVSVSSSTENGFIFKNLVESVSPERIYSGAKLFNVRYIVAHTDPLKKVLQSSDHFISAEAFPPYHIFTVKGSLLSSIPEKGSDFAIVLLPSKGSGSPPSRRTPSDLKRIEITPFSQKGDRILVKIAYDPNWAFIKPPEAKGSQGASRGFMISPHPSGLMEIQLPDRLKEREKVVIEYRDAPKVLRITGGTTLLIVLILLFWPTGWRAVTKPAR